MKKIKVRSVILPQDYDHMLCEINDMNKELDPLEVVETVSKRIRFIVHEYYKK